MLSIYRGLGRLQALFAALTGRGGGATLENSIRYGWDTLAGDRDSHSLVVFCGTIGEFNSVRPLIDAYLEEWPDDRLVLLAGQSQYFEALHAVYPDAIIGQPRWRTPANQDRFIALARPRLVVLEEGPCLYGRFPVTLELPLLASCLANDVPAVVANACLYDLKIGSRVDALEYKLFAGIHRQAIRHWYASSPEFQSDLIKAGAPAERISVPGDLKVDAIARPLKPPSEELASILSGYRECGHPVLIAGSVNAADEQQAVVDAWLNVRENFQGARLILAPRYVNNPDVMQALAEVLDRTGVRWARRSGLVGNAADYDVLVIDVFGELAYYYEVASISYVGRNHGVLEPLRFGSPTVVSSEWRRDYVTYPLYRILVDDGAILKVGDPADLGARFQELLRDEDTCKALIQNAAQLQDQHGGVAARIVESLRSILGARKTEHV